MDGVADKALVEMAGEALVIAAVVSGVRLVRHARRRVAGGRLAIPASVEERELLIIVTYGVALVTLVLPGLTLAPRIRAFGLGQSEQHRRQEAEARMRLAHAALEARLDRLRDRLEEAGGHPDHRTETAVAQIEALDAERELQAEMRRERAFPAELLRELDAEIDVDEARVRSRGR